MKVVLVLNLVLVVQSKAPYLLKFSDMIRSNDEAKLKELVNGSIPASIVTVNIRNKIMLNIDSILSNNAMLNQAKWQNKMYR